MFEHPGRRHKWLEPDTHPDNRGGRYCMLCTTTRPPSTLLECRFCRQRRRAGITTEWRRRTGRCHMRWGPVPRPHIWRPVYAALAAGEAE